MTRHICCDVETDSKYYWQVKNVWIIVCYDLDTQETREFPLDEPDYLKRFKAYAEQEETTWVGHNFLNYDRHVLSRFAGVTIPTKRVIDTLILSRLLSPVRPGGHSLEAWGQFFKQFKVKHEEWDRYSPAMRLRCVGDVELNVKLYSYLLRALKPWSRRSIRMEHTICHILENMKQRGWTMDVQKVDRLYQTTQAHASDLRDRIVANFLPLPKPVYGKDDMGYKVVKVYTPKYVKAKKGEARRFSLVGGIQAWLGPGWLEQITEGVPFTRVHWVPLNLNSSPQVVERLERAHWQPVEFNKPCEAHPKGSPKVSENNLATLPADAPEDAKSIKEYLIVNSRQAMAKGWKSSIWDDGKMHGSVIHIMANTGRSSHRDPQTSNIPAVYSREGELQLYGKESRECWTVAKGRRLVGVDASSVQFRLLAHHIGNPSYIKTVSTKNIHAFHAGLLWDTTDEALIKKKRPPAKTYGYAMLFGSGNSRLGGILGGDARTGAKSRRLMRAGIPGLEKFEDEALEDWARQGYYEAIDGRRTPIKSRHYALAVVLQQDENILMKRSMIIWTQAARVAGLDAHLVGFNHDEVQIDCAEEVAEVAEEAGGMFVAAIEEAGRVLGFKCPMTGQVKIGTDWSQTH